MPPADKAKTDQAETEDRDQAGFGDSNCCAAFGRDGRREDHPGRSADIGEIDVKRIDAGLQQRRGIGAGESVDRIEPAPAGNAGKCYAVQEQPLIDAETWRCRPEDVVDCEVKIDAGSTDDGVGNCEFDRIQARRSVIARGSAAGGRI